MLASLLSVLLVLSILAGISPSAYGASESNILDCAEFKCDEYGWEGPVVVLKNDGTISFLFRKTYDFMDDWEITPDVEKKLEIIRGWKNVVQIAVKEVTIAALLEDGTVKVLSLYDDEYVPDLSKVEKWKNIRSLVGFNGIHLFALGYDGKLYVAGQDRLNKMDRYDFSRWQDLKKVACCNADGDECLLGLKADGTVLDILDSSYLGEDSWSGDSENIVDIAVMRSMNAALRADGTVIIQGLDRENYEKEVSSWNNIVRIFAHHNYGLVGVKSDGSLVMTEPIGYYEDQYQEIANWRNSKEIYSSENGMVVALGENGKLDICPSYYEDWEEMKEWTRIDRLYLGSNFVIGWKRDGSIVTWNIDLTEID